MKVVMRQVILLLGGLFLFSIFVCPTVAFAQESSATESANGETNTALLENGVDTIVEPKMFEVGVVIRVLEEQTWV